MNAKFAQFAASKPKIILGSASSSRRLIMDELAKQYNFKYDVLTADIDEKAIRHEEPKELVLTLGKAKATAIIARMKQESSSMEGYLLTCDQVVVHEGQIREKPESKEEARRFISGYGRSPASTVGSVICTNLATGKVVEMVDSAHIHFSDIPEHVVEQMIEEGSVFYCAGGLMVEHALVQPYLLRIDGTQDSVMGLAKALVIETLLAASA